MEGTSSSKSSNHPSPRREAKRRKEIFVSEAYCISIVIENKLVRGMPRYPARAPQREPFSTELKGQNRQTIHKAVYVSRPGRASAACYR